MIFSFLAASDQLGQAAVRISIPNYVTSSHKGAKSNG